MRDTAGRIISLCIFAPIYLGVLYLGLNYTGNLLAQLVPVFTHFLDTKQGVGLHTVVWFNSKFFFSMPESYVWMYYIFGSYFIMTGIILPALNFFKQTGRPKGTPNSGRNYAETEGERLDRLKAETERNLAELKQQQQMQMMQQMPMYVPPQPQVQIVPIPVQLNKEQLTQFHETKQKMEKMTQGNGASETAQMGAEMTKKEDSINNTTNGENASNNALGAENEPPVEKVIKPAVSPSAQQAPKEKPKAFKRNRNIPKSEDDLEFKKPVGVPTEIYKD